MKTTFIPLDYDSFDWEGKNYAKLIGRDDKGKRVCVIDTCPIYMWAILKEGVILKSIIIFYDEVCLHFWQRPG